MVNPSVDTNARLAGLPIKPAVPNEGNEKACLLHMCLLFILVGRINLVVVFGSKFLEVAGTYEWYFFIL